MVDLPEADRPVNQSVKPFCLRRDCRSVCVTEESCHVTFLGRGLVCGSGLGRGGVGRGGGGGGPTLPWWILMLRGREGGRKANVMYYGAVAIISGF